jgi:large subunit ribosomal protein L20
MTRVKRGLAAHARHKKVLTAAKGFRGRSSKCFRPALERLERSWQFAYRDRKVKKRDFRGLWIQRINAAVRELGLRYSTFMNGLKRSNIEIDRKILAKLAVEDRSTFDYIVAQAKKGLESTTK